MSFSFRNRGASDEGDAGAPRADRRRVLLLGGLGAGTVAAVGVAAVVLTSSGGGADVAMGVPPKPPAATAAPTAAPTATASPTTSADVPVTGAEARDPFQPLVVAEAAGTGAASSAAGSDSTGAPVATGSTAPTPSGPATTHTTAADPPSKKSAKPSAKPSATPSSEPSSTSSSSSSSGSPAKTWFRSSAGADPTKASVRVTLDIVTAGNAWATLRVDGKKYLEVKPGGEFAERFRVLELRDDRCGTLEYGSDYRFDICEGHTRALS